jgi:signal transduction histidine kinase
MDYRRAELGVFELKVKQENAHQLIQDNFLFYDKLARHKKITYTLHSELEEKEELFDPNYLELIVNNLLSNAFYRQFQIYRKRAKHYCYVERGKQLAGTAS